MRNYSDDIKKKDKTNGIKSGSVNLKINESYRLSFDYYFLQQTACSVLLGWGTLVP